MSFARSCGGQARYDTVGNGCTRVSAAQEFWAISTTENALTAHVKLKDLARMEDTRSLLKEFLHHQGISHATLEFESASFPCPEA